MKQEHDMCAEIQTHRLTFILNPDNIWSSYESECKKITEKGGWQEVKFLNQDESCLNPDIDNVPNNCGGVYLFILKGQIIPEDHTYILYVGRVQYTSTQNLRKRLKEYFGDNRPKIAKMRETWGGKLYIKYLPLKDNSIITKLESELIRVIIPPCNEQYPKVINKAIKAAFM